MFKFWKLIAVVKADAVLYTYTAVKREIYFKLYKSIFGQRKVDISCNDLTIGRYQINCAAHEQAVYHQSILPWCDGFDDEEFLNEYKKVVQL